MIYYRQAVQSGHLDFYQYHDDKEHRSMLFYQGKNPENKVNKGYRLYRRIKGKEYELVVDESILKRDERC